MPVKTIHDVYSLIDGLFSGLRVSLLFSVSVRTFHGHVNHARHYENISWSFPLVLPNLLYFKPG